MTNRETYILIQDNDCHWYLIPYDKRDSFYEYLDLIDNFNYDAEDPYPDEPDWLKRVDGPESIIIHEYTEK